MPFVDINGRTGATDPEQIGATASKTGVTFGTMVISKVVAAVAHCPAAGVKVYVAVPVADVLITAGFHVPEIPLLDIAGKTGATEFTQSGPMSVNIGLI